MSSRSDSRSSRSSRSSRRSRSPSPQPSHAQAKGHAYTSQWSYGYTLQAKEVTGTKHVTKIVTEPGEKPEVPPETKTEPEVKPEVKTETTKPEEKPEVKSEKKPEVKAEGNPEGSAQTEQSEEDGRPLEEILRGRQPIMWCNDQSKYRGLEMEWEQVSETGPPHDRTFTWSLKMGEIVTTGAANSKKGAKSKAAEEMAKKLDKLPRPNKRPYPPMQMRPPFGPPPPFFYYNNMPPNMPPWMMRPHMRGPHPHFNNKRPRMMPPHPGMPGPGMPPEMDMPPVAIEPSPYIPTGKKPLMNPSANNPISKLYEHAKRNRLPEPIFEVISENVLDTKKTKQGFHLKRTEYTMQCTVLGKKFVGSSLTKKQAKHVAAEAAWADIGGGVAQKDISKMLQEQRNADK